MDQPAEITPAPKIRYYRKVIRITAEDSPNVRRALHQKGLGKEPDGKEVLPGVLNWDQYCQRRATWDAVRQCIGLDARFYQGAELLLFPPVWLNRANDLASKRTFIGNRVWMGIDPAEGGDKSSWSLIDDQGLFKLLSLKTPVTTAVVSITLDLIREHKISPDDICMDRGGGGKQHADRLREMGYPVRTIAFGEATTAPIKRMRTSKSFPEKIEAQEDKYIYFNRRAELYGEMSIMLDPYETGSGVRLKEHKGFTIPAGGIFDELRKQLAPIPKTWDRGGEGRLKLLPKNNTEDPDDPRTLVKLIGHSPDEADSLALAIHARLHPAKAVRVGAWY